MSRTNYEAVADFAGHWLHRAQVSLLTGEIGQIKLSHIRKKNPGAGLARAWCGPGGVVVSNTPTPNHKETSPNGLNGTQLRSRQESSPVRSKKRLAPWPTP